jgi:CHRD domain/PEP-CTERM motif
MTKPLITLFAALFLWTSGAQAAPILYFANFSGLNEVPSVTSPGTGTASVIYDPSARTLLVDVDFANLTGSTTVAHIHCCALPGANAGVATPTPSFPDFPTNVTAGAYSRLFDLTLSSSFNAGFITANGGTPAGAEAALATGLAEGKAYFNIHTDLFRAGEIRANLTAVPEPATWSLLGLSVVVLMASRRKRRSL